MAASTRGQTLRILAEAASVRTVAHCRLSHCKCARGACGVRRVLRGAAHLQHAVENENPTRVTERLFLVLEESALELR